MEGGIVYISQVTSYGEWQEFVRNCYIAYPDIFIICVIASAVLGLFCYDRQEEIVFRIKAYWNLIKVVIKKR